MTEAEQALARLFERSFGQDPAKITELKAHASERRLFRLVGSGRSVIGVLNRDHKENRAFVGFARHFRSHKLPVPEIYAESAAEGIYLQQDLGDTTLFDVLTAKRTATDPFPALLRKLYQSALETLPKFQISAGLSLDFSLCSPTADYDQHSMRWDVNYFEQEFLQPTKIGYNAAALHTDFDRLIAFLLEAKREYFMYRDFQARNIMVLGDELYFIDFQGGRRGPLHYDVASILNQSRAELPLPVREELLAIYLDALKGYQTVDPNEFRRHYLGFSLIRLLQVLGTYGKEGWGKGKQYFRKSIPQAMITLRYLREQGFPAKVPELERVLAEISQQFGGPV